ncbi:hypothetical protein [Azospirillum argentinense]
MRAAVKPLAEQDPRYLQVLENLFADNDAVAMALYDGRVSYKQALQRIDDLSRGFDNSLTALDHQNMQEAQRIEAQRQSSLATWLAITAPAPRQEFTCFQYGNMTKCR